MIEQVFLCFKNSLKSVLKLLKYLNSVDKVTCFHVIKSTRVNSCLLGSCFQRMVFFKRSYKLHWNTNNRTTETAYNISRHSKLYRQNQNFPGEMHIIFVRLCRSPANPISCKFNQWIFSRCYLMPLWVKTGNKSALWSLSHSATSPHL